MAKPRPASIADVHELAASFPGVERTEGSAQNAIYQVRRSSFVFFRNPRPDAVDPDTGKRYSDVIVLWVDPSSEAHGSDLAF